jgi:hypothetical protein
VEPAPDATAGGLTSDDGDAPASAVTEGEGVPVGEPVGVADGLPLADADAAGAPALGALVVPVAGFFVGLEVAFLVGVGLGCGCAFNGVAPGARWLLLDCPAKATKPPLGTLSASTLTVEYTQ